MDDFPTPKEAALEAEVARLRAENKWLRSAVEAPNVLVRPWAVEEDVVLRDIGPEVRLVRSAGVRGKLMEDGRWHVIAFTEARLCKDKELHVAYYTPNAAEVNVKSLNENVFANHILPKLHEQFIRQLSQLYRTVS
jgi:hypothetical protein